MNVLADAWHILALSGVTAFLYTTAMCELCFESYRGDRSLFSAATRRGIGAFGLMGLVLLLLMRSETLGPDSPELAGAFVLGAFLGAARVAWVRLIAPRL